MQYHPARRRAFTLIEILVVIAIIALLAGLLFPVFARAREEGRKTSCASNMKQLGIAFQQYTQDSRGKYPLAGQFGNWLPGSGTWVAGDTANPIADLTTQEPNGNKANIEAGALFPYVKSTAVYICPSNKDGEAKSLSYSMNCAVAALSSSRIRSPGDIVLLVDEEKANDAYFFAVSDGPANLAGSTAAGNPTNSSDALTKKHNGGGNLLFADGHVKFFPFDNFALDGSAQGLANKWKTGGSPRFHDRSFGPYGSNKRADATADACNATQGPGNADGTGNIPAAAAPAP